MKLKKNIASSEAGFIFNPSTGDSFSVNSIGAEILNMLKINKTQEEIYDYITVKYEVEKIQLEKDMDDFVSLLTEYNLLD